MWRAFGIAALGGKKRARYIKTNAQCDLKIILSLNSFSAGNMGRDDSHQSHPEYTCIVTRVSNVHHGIKVYQGDMDGRKRASVGKKLKPAFAVLFSVAAGPGPAGQAALCPPVCLTARRKKTWLCVSVSLRPPPRHLMASFVRQALFFWGGGFPPFLHLSLSFCLSPLIPPPPFLIFTSLRPLGVVRGINF